GPGRYDQFYGASPYGPPEYNAAMATPPDVEGEAPTVRSVTVHPAPSSMTPSSVAGPGAASAPPLPRPRPAALASRNPADANPAISAPPAPSPNRENKVEPAGGTASSENAPAGNAATPSPVSPPASSIVTTTKAAGSPDGKPQINSEVVTAPP